MGIFKKIAHAVTHPLEDVKQVVGGVINSAPDPLGVLPKQQTPMAAMQQMMSPDLSNYATVQQLDDYYAKLMDQIANIQPIVGNGQSGQLAQPSAQTSPLAALNSMAYRGNNFTQRGGFGALYGR